MNIKKRFYISSSIAVIGSSLIAVIFSTILFAVDLKYGVSNAPTLIAFLGYLTDLFNALAVFIGFGTIIYAFFKFDFYEGVMSCLIFAASFIPYFLYNAIARYIYTKAGIIELGAADGFDPFEAIMMAVNYAMGSGVINQILPAILVAFIACKVIKQRKSEPLKFISYENRLQRAMIITCLALFGVNLLMLILTGILPTILGDATLFIQPSKASEFTKAIIIDLVKLVALYLIFGYIMFMLIYKFYNAILAKASSPKDTECKEAV
ncbi:MAG: hypothetical protein IJW10_04245 [Clostridia bacterium]|nr:hypothetical protein [Clostridia bacterium]